MSTILRKKSRTIVRDSKSDALFYVICYAIVAILCLIVLYPLIYILSASFSSPAQVSSGRVWLFPVEPTLYSYSLILQYKNVFIGYGNTIFYTVVGTLINVALTMICAYPLSRREFSGRYVCSLIFVFTMVFNAGMIPNYILIRDLHLMNTRWAMILPGAISAYNMIVARTFIQNSIPNELLEAPKLDGCDDFQYFFHIVLPLSTTVISVIALYYAVAHWNSYFNAFLYLSDRKLYPLQIFLRQILVQNNFDTSEVTDPELAQQLQGLNEVLKYSIIVVSSAPLMCLYPFVQKHFVKGVMIGSVKG